ncbi:MAG: SseB family protein [Lachnospiraceae bacterium]|nr:SseB family protein [Lachnospiraceae bacterium]
MIDNTELEKLTAEFAKDRSKENFVKVMEQLEKSTILVPTMTPENISSEDIKQAKQGKQIKLSKEAKFTPCLLKKETGEQALPIFSSQGQIPKDKMSPAVLAMPFFTCVSMVMDNAEKVEAVVLNPFTQSIVITKQVLEVAQKRSSMPETKQVKLTEKQFHQLAHRRVSYELLPVFLYEKGYEGLEQLQNEEGKFILSLFTSVYPKEIKVPYNEDEISFMTLNITDNLQITRIDMPDKNLIQGMCSCIYIVWKRDTEELYFYTIEKGEEGSSIARVYADRKHEIVEPAPDNGAEIEAIMNLVSKAE